MNEKKQVSKLETGEKFRLNRHCRTHEVAGKTDSYVWYWDMDSQAHRIWFSDPANDFPVEIVS